MIYAAILAGGSGKRIGGKIPKQFLVLDDKPILIQTLEKFLQSDKIDFIYISVHKDWELHTNELLRNHFSEKERDKMKVILGGVERMMTLINVVYDIRDNFGIHKKDIILSHDAVRPFVSEDIIDDCVAKTLEAGVAMASVGSNDTTYLSEKAGYLTKTYDRKNVYEGQTPQGCRMDLMYEVINSYTEEQLLSMTGTSQLFVNRGIPIRISLGSRDNLKITTPQDIELIKYHLQARKNKEKGE